MFSNFPVDGKFFYFQNKLLNIIKKKFSFVYNVMFDVKLKYFQVSNR